MLAEMSPSQYAEWMAADVAIPLDNGWQQSGIISATIANEFLKLASAFGKSRLSESDLYKPDDFIPLHSAQPVDREKGKESLDAFAKQLSARFS